jgi:hypothetical protein
MKLRHVALGGLAAVVGAFSWHAAHEPNRSVSPPASIVSSHKTPTARDAFLQNPTFWNMEALRTPPNALDISLGFRSFHREIKPLSTAFTPVAVLDSYDSDRTESPQVQSGLDLLVGSPSAHTPQVGIQSGGTIISSNIVQTDGANNPALINYTITNSNPGAVFNSASVEFLAQFSESLEYVLAYNPALAGMSMDELLANYVKISIDSASNIELVNQGWNQNLNSSTGILSFGQAPFGYEQWRNSTEGTPHTLKYTIQFGDVANQNPLLQNIFDVNGDGIVQDSERLIVNTNPQTTPQFVGYMDIDNQYPAALPVYGILDPIQPTTTISSNISQPNNATPAVFYTITNSNPGAVFNSASVEFLAQFSESLEYVLAYNSALAGMSMNELLANYVSVTIDSASNIELVNSGWNRNLNSSTGMLSFTNNGLDPDLDYDVWRSSTEGTPHTLKYTILFGDPNSSNNKLKNIFDVNGDGIVQDSERLIVNSNPQTTPQFVGYMDIDNQYPAALPVYGILDPIPLSGETVINFAIVQNNNSTTIEHFIQNANPNITFNSASAYYQGQIGSVLEYILEHNQSLKDLGITNFQQLVASGLISVNINQTGEVHQGWSANIGTDGIVSLNHNGLVPDSDYQAWHNIFYNPNQDTIQIKYNFGNPASADPKLQNIFDLNGDGQIQPFEKVIVEEDPSVFPLFVGTMNAENQKITQLPVYKIEQPLQERQTNLTQVVSQEDGETPQLQFAIQNANSDTQFTSAQFDLFNKIEPILSYIVTHNSAVQQQGITTPQQLLQSGLVTISLNQSNNPIYVHNGWQTEIQENGSVIISSNVGAEEWSNTQSGQNHTLEAIISLGTQNPVLNPQNKKQLSNLLDLNENDIVDPFEIIAPNAQPSQTPQITIQTSNIPITKTFTAYTIANPGYSEETQVHSQFVQQDGVTPQITTTIVNNNYGIEFTSAVTDLQTQIKHVLEYILTHNSAVQQLGYTTPQQLIESGLVELSINQTPNPAYVHNGWQATPNANAISITPSAQADTWQSSESGAKYTLEVIAKLGSLNPAINPTYNPLLSNLLDLNGNNMVDSTEAMAQHSNPSQIPQITIQTSTTPITKTLPAYTIANPTFTAETYVTTQLFEEDGEAPQIITTIQNANSGLLFTSATAQVLTQLQPILEYIITHNGAVNLHGITTPEQLLESGLIEISINQSAQPEYVNTGWNTNVQDGNIVVAPQGGAEQWKNIQAGNPNTLEYKVKFGTQNPALNPTNTPLLQNLLDLNGNGRVDSYETIIQGTQSAQISMQNTGVAPIVKVVPTYIIANPGFSQETQVISELTQQNGITPQITTTIINQNYGVEFTSANVEIQAQLESVLNYILTHNNAVQQLGYTTPQQLIESGLVELSINQTPNPAYVHNGWQATPNANAISITPSAQADTWQSSESGAKYTLEVIAKLGSLNPAINPTHNPLLSNLLDLNGNNMVDSTEAMAQHSNPSQIPQITIQTSTTPIAKSLVAYHIPNQNFITQSSIDSTVVQENGQTPYITIDVQNAHSGLTFSQLTAQSYQQIAPILSHIVSQNSALAQLGITTPEALFASGLIEVYIPQTAAPEYIQTGWQVDKQGEEVIVSPGVGAQVWKDIQLGNPNSLEVRLQFGTQNVALNPNANPLLSNLLDFNANGEVDLAEEIVSDSQANVQVIIQNNGLTPLFGTVPVYMVANPAFDVQAHITSQIIQNAGETPYILTSVQNTTPLIDLESATAQVVAQMQPVLEYAILHNSELKNANITTIADLFASGLVSVVLDQSAQPQYVNAQTGWNALYNSGTGTIDVTKATGGQTWTNTHAGNPNTLVYRINLGNSSGLVNPSLKEKLTSIVDLNGDGQIQSYEQVALNPTPSQIPLLTLNTTNAQTVQKPLPAYTMAQPYVNPNHTGDDALAALTYRITPVGQKDIQYSYNALPGLEYQMHTSTSLAADSWVPIGSKIIVFEPSQIIEHYNCTQPRQFFRISIKPAE